MILSRKYSFQAARKLIKVDSSHICSNLHGHTFMVTIKIEGPINHKNDFVIDFYDLDAIFNKSVFNKLDHKHLNKIEGLKSPTTENISIWIWHQLIIGLPILKEVSVFENDLYGCTYKGE